MIKKSDLLLCLITAILLPVAFVVPYAGILSWVLLIPFFIAIENKSPWNAFRLGMFTGTIGHVIGTYWIIDTLSRFSGFPYVLCILFHFILSAYTGAYIGIFAYVTGRLKLFARSGLLYALLIASVWASVEFLFPFLFPYGVANSQSQYLPLLQISDLFGIYSLSFVIIFVNVVFMRLFQSLKQNTPKPVVELITTLVLFVLIIGYGIWRMGDIDKKVAESKKIKVGIVQGNFDFFEKVEDNENMITATHKAMSESLTSPDLVVWPETAIQAWVPVGVDYMLEMGKSPIPNMKGTHFLVGGLSYEIFKTGPVSDENMYKYNTAFFTDSDGKILGRYYKIKLLLFGEYLPLSTYFPSLKELSPATGDFVPGRELNLFEIKEKGLRIAPLICYEDIIPSFPKHFADKGANLLVNMTNDAWFGRTFAAYQHLLVALPRTIETRLYLVRATNTGVSAIIDPVGRIVARTNIFERTTLEREVAIMDIGKTLYVRIGDTFAYLCLAFWVGFGIITTIQNRRRVSSM